MEKFSGASLEKNRAFRGGEIRGGANEEKKGPSG